MGSSRASSRHCSRPASCRTWRDWPPRGGWHASRRPTLPRRRWPGRPSRRARTRAAKASSTSSGATPETYLPDLGLNRYEQKNPFAAPEGGQSATRDAGLGAALGGGDHLDRAPVPVHLPARPHPRADALGHGCARLEWGVRHRRRSIARTSPSPPARARMSCGSKAMAMASVAGTWSGPSNLEDRADCRFDITTRALTRAAAGRRPLWRIARRVRGQRGRMERLVAGEVQGSGCSSRSMGSCGSFWSGSSRRLSSTPRRSTSTPRPRCSRSAPRRTTPRQTGRHLGPYYTPGLVEEHNGLSNDGSTRTPSWRSARTPGASARR